MVSLVKPRRAYTHETTRCEEGRVIPREWQMPKWWRSLCWLKKSIPWLRREQKREKSTCFPQPAKYKSSAVALMLVVTEPKCDPNKNLLFIVNSKQVMLPHKHVCNVQTNGKGEGDTLTISSGQDWSYQLLTKNYGYVNIVCLHPLLGSQIQNPSIAWDH